MKTFIFSNSNRHSVWLSAKALIEYSKEDSNFYAIFDTKNDILTQIPELYGKVYFNDDSNVVRDRIIGRDVVHLDFDIDWFISGHNNYEEYIGFKIFGDTKKDCPKLKFYISNEKTKQIKDYITKFDKCNFSNVFLNINNADYYSIVEEFLKDKVNLITINNEITTMERYFIISMCEYAVTDTDVEHIICNELGIPNFVIIDNPQNSLRKNKFCDIFNPFKNDLKRVPPAIFKNDHELAKNINDQIIQYSNIDELLCKEIQDSLDKFKISYVTEPI